MCDIAQAPMDLQKPKINTEQQQQQENPQQDNLLGNLQLGNPQQENLQQDNLLGNLQLGNLQQGNLQQDNLQDGLQENSLQMSLQRTQQMMRQQDGIQDTPTSQNLERAAEVGFEKGINSRKGSCDTRNTKRKKAHVRKKFNNAAGLTEYSATLSDQLKGSAERNAKRQEDSGKYFDRWIQSDIGDSIMGGANPDAIELRKNYMVKVGGYLKDDRSRNALMGTEPIARAMAYEELMDRAMEFELQPNACCTVSVMKRGAQVIEHGNLVELVDQMLDGMNEKLKEKLPESKVAQYRQYSRVFHLLNNSTADTIKLQGLNEDGSNKYKFEENSSLTQRIGLSRERSYLKENQRSDSSNYERELESYRSNSKSAEEQEKDRLADIKKITGVDMSVQSFELMRKLSVYNQEAIVHLDTGSKRCGTWQGTPVGRKATEAAWVAMDKSSSKKTEEDKDCITMEETGSMSYLAHYLPHDPDSENACYGNNPQLRAREISKIILQVKEKFDAIDFKADINHYLNPANFDDYAAVDILGSEVTALQNLLVNPRVAKHINGAELEAVSGMHTVCGALMECLNSAMPLNHVSTSGVVHNSDPEFVVKNEEFKVEFNIESLEAQMQKLSQRGAETSTPEEQAKLNAEIAALTAQWEASTSQLQQMKDTREERKAAYIEKETQDLVTSRDQNEATYLKMREPIAAEKQKRDLAKEALEKEKLAQEKLAQEKLAKEKQEQEDIAWERALRERLEKEYNGTYPEEKVTAAKKERSDFIRRKAMSPLDAQKDMVEESKKWIADWTASDEGKAYTKDQFAFGGSRVMTKEQTADATLLSYLLTDTQRKDLFSTGSSKRAAVGRELYHIIMGDTEIKKNAPQEELNKIKVQQDVAQLASSQNAKALLRLAQGENYSFLTDKQVEEMIPLLR